MKKTLTYGLAALVVAGAVFYFWHLNSAKAPQTAQTTQSPEIAPPEAVLPPNPPPLAPDPRLEKLQTFLNAHNCADAGLVADYLRLADNDGLDWRLLPAISYKEESCTKNLKKNNLWGWQSGVRTFPSLLDGLTFVANQLYSNPLYAGKTTLQKLRIYNNHPEYAPSVESIMSMIGE